MTSHRIERVADMLRQEISQILREEVRDPRVRDASVSRVEVSSDLQHARVLVSLLADDPEGKALEGLHRAGGFIRSRLAGRIQLRHVPELRFEIDHGAEHSLRITEILDSLEPTSSEDDDGEPTSTHDSPPSDPSR